MRKRTFPGRLDKLADISLFVVQAAEEAGLDDSGVYAVELAVDEAATNIIEHAYQGEDRGEICCSIEVNRDGLKVILQDWGSPFDPKKVPSLPLEPLSKRFNPAAWGYFSYGN